MVLEESGLVNAEGSFCRRSELAKLTKSTVLTMLAEFDTYAPESLYLIGHGRESYWRFFRIHPFLGQDHFDSRLLTTPRPFLLDYFHAGQQYQKSPDRKSLREER